MRPLMAYFIVLHSPSLSVVGFYDPGSTTISDRLDGFEIYMRSMRYGRIRGPGCVHTGLNWEAVVTAVLITIKLWTGYHTQLWCQLQNNFNASCHPDDRYLQSAADGVGKR
jgi:hypothetical protein